MRLVIVCVETNKRANTDASYINKAIRHFYDVDNNEVRLAFKFYDSKRNYADKKKLKEIKTVKRLEKRIQQYYFA